MPTQDGSVDIANEALSIINQKTILSFNDQNQLARTVSFWYDKMRRELLRDCDWTFSRRVIQLNLIGQMTGVQDFPDWAQIVAPTIGATPLGANWVSTTAYVPGNVVFLSGNNYVCIVANTNQTPPNTQFWFLLPNTQPAQDNDADDNLNLTANNDVFPWSYIYSYPPSCLFIRSIYSITRSGAFPEPFYAWSPDPEGPEWRSGNNDKWEVLRSRSTNELAIATNVQQATCKYTFDMLDTSQFDQKFCTALALKIAQRICMPLTGDKDLKQIIDKDLTEAMTDAYRINLSEYPEKGPRSSFYERTRGVG